MGSLLALPVAVAWVCAADPLLMLQSGNTSQIRTAVTTIAASAQVLGVMTVARALAECQSVQLSNELFAEKVGSRFWTLACCVQGCILGICVLLCQ